MAQLFKSRAYKNQGNVFTVAILAQGTSWAVAATQAFFPHLVKDSAFLALSSTVLANWIMKESTNLSEKKFLPPEAASPLQCPDI